MASQAEMLTLYGLLQSAPGKTMAQKLNWLQDIGFNPLGKGVTPFQESPQPMMYNQYDVYKSNPDMEAAFDLMQNYGKDPMSAAKELNIPTVGVMGGESPELKILMGWAETNAANQAKQQQWELEQGAARQKWEAEQPTTMKDVTGRTAYDVLSETAGEPLTPQSLVSAYARNKYVGNKPINVPVRGTMPSTEFGSDPAVAKMIRGRLEGVAGRRLGAAKQKFVPSEKGQQLLDLMSLYSALGE